DVDGTDQTSLGQFSGRVQQTYKHSVPRFFVPEHGTMFTLALRSEERFSRNAETDLVCRLLLEKKKKKYDRNRKVYVSKSIALPYLDMRQFIDELYSYRASIL